MLPRHGCASVKSLQDRDDRGNGAGSYACGRNVSGRTGWYSPERGWWCELDVTERRVHDHEYIRSLAQSADGSKVFYAGTNGSGLQKSRWGTHLATNAVCIPKGLVGGDPAGSPRLPAGLAVRDESPIGDRRLECAQRRTVRVSAALISKPDAFGNVVCPGFACRHDRATRSL